MSPYKAGNKNKMSLREKTIKSTIKNTNSTISQTVFVKNAILVILKANLVNTKILCVILVLNTAASLYSQEDEESECADGQHHSLVLYR